jgi:hypothetical protein
MTNGFYLPLFIPFLMTVYIRVLLYLSLWYVDYIAGIDIQRNSATLGIDLDNKI